MRLKTLDRALNFITFSQCTDEMINISEVAEVDSGETVITTVIQLQISKPRQIDAVVSGEVDKNDALVRNKLTFQLPLQLKQ